MTADQLHELFCENIRLLRLEAGLSQSDLARQIGVRPSYICDLERARRSPNLRTLATLAEALGVSPGTLVSTVRKKIQENHPVPA